MAKTQLLPPIHPGEMLRDELEERGLSMNQLARELRVPMNRISAIVNGRRAISADTALRLARFFGTSAQMWMNLQADYDLEIAARTGSTIRNRDARRVPDSCALSTEEGTCSNVTQAVQGSSLVQDGEGRVEDLVGTWLGTGSRLGLSVRGGLEFAGK